LLRGRSGTGSSIGMLRSQRMGEVAYSGYGGGGGVAAIHAKNSRVAAGVKRTPGSAQSPHQSFDHQPSSSRASSRAASAFAYATAYHAGFLSYAYSSSSDLR